VPFSLIQSSVVSVTASASTAQTVSFPGANAANDLLTAIVTLGSTVRQVGSIVDSAGNAWALARRQQDTVSPANVEIWYARNAIASTNRVTVNYGSTLASTAFVELGIHEWVGASTETTVLSSVNGQTAASSLCGTGGITNPASGALVIAAWRRFSGYTQRSNPSGYSTLAPGQQSRSNAMWKQPISTASENPIWTVTTSTRYVGAIVTFLPSTEVSGSRAGQACFMLGLI
jgi:hypothetical protein